MRKVALHTTHWISFAASFCITVSMTLTPTEETKEKGDEYAYSLELGLSYAFCIFGIAIPLHLSLGSLDSLVGKCLSFQAGVKKSKRKKEKKKKKKRQIYSSLRFPF